MATYPIAPYTTRRCATVSPLTIPDAYCTENDPSPIGMLIGAHRVARLVKVVAFRPGAAAMAYDARRTRGRSIKMLEAAMGIIR